MLIAHGSSLEPAGGPAVVTHARAIAARGLFASVRPGLLNGAPSVEDAFAQAQTQTVYVVPYFMSEGAAVTSMIPERLGPDPRLRFCEPVGTHPEIATIVARQARDMCRTHDIAPEDTALLLVGHGTLKSPASAEATRACAARIAGFAAVDTAFLDQDPTLGEAIKRPAAPVTVVAGFFADAGGHAAVYIPKILGLAAGETSVRRADGTTFLYTGAVGTDPAMADVILARVAEVG